MKFITNIRCDSLNYIENTNISRLKSLGMNNTLINCKFIGEDIEIGNNCTIRNCIIASGATITDSYIEDSLIGRDCLIGPYSRIRGKSNIGDKSKIGNFVEIKNSQLGVGVKASHHSYIGDAIIGDNTNISCGVIFANYNGITKRISKVGTNCFLGCNVNIIAPVNIADDTYICAGTTITENTEKGDFLIGRVVSTKKQKYSYYLKNNRK